MKMSQVDIIISRAPSLSGAEVREREKEREREREREEREERDSVQTQRRETESSSLMRGTESVTKDTRLRAQWS